MHIQMEVCFIAQLYKGYGQFRYRGTRAAHRVALIAHIAEFDVPAILQASHLCNNKLCIKWTI